MRGASQHAIGEQKLLFDSEGKVKGVVGLCWCRVAIPCFGREARIDTLEDLIVEIMRGEANQVMGQWMAKYIMGGIAIH